MTRNLASECDRHPDPADCLDSLVSYLAPFDEYGIRVHDGGSSSVVISYCPWCGERLPRSRRDEWFATLEGMGFDTPSEQEIPPEFTTDGWYRAGV